jgi:hypothetical protein
MKREHLLNQLFAASPQSKRRQSTCERVCYSGYVSQIMRKNLNNGARDIRRTTQQDLINEGVPISVARADKNRGTKRKFLSYANVEYFEWQRGHPEATSEECRRVRSEIVKKWSKTDTNNADTSLGTALDLEHDGEESEIEQSTYMDEALYNARSSLWEQMLASFDYPLKPNLLGDYLGKSHSPNAAVVSSFTRLRREEAESLYVRNKGANLLVHRVRAII